MKAPDTKIIEKAIELQRLATSDYNNIYNTLTGTGASETILSLLSDELRIAEDVKRLLSFAGTPVQETAAERDNVRRIIRQLKSS